MAGHKYILLLNECLKKALPSLGLKEKERLTEKLEFLRAGLWDAGLRVKKLKGSSDRVVFEARFSKADRMLFTLGRRGSQTAIYLWGLLGHDEVNRTARRVFPENAPFLDFVPESQEDYSEMILDDLPAAVYVQEAIEAQAPEDYGPQRWLVLSDEEWRRLLTADKAGGAGTASLSDRRAGAGPGIGPAGPPFGHGRERQNHPGRVLSPEAGVCRAKRKLFLTYNPFLRDFSRRLYDGLTARTGPTDPGGRPDFYVFRDLLRSLLGPSAGAFDPGREVRLRDFESSSGITGFMAGMTPNWSGKRSGQSSRAPSRCSGLDRLKACPRPTCRAPCPGTR